MTAGPSDQFFQALLTSVHKRQLQALVKSLRSAMVPVLYSPVSLPFTSAVKAQEEEGTIGSGAAGQQA